MKEHCKEVLQQAYLFLDHEGLSDAQRHEIETHLNECTPCYERYGLEREVAQLISRLRGTEACPDKLKNKIFQLIQEV